jgi:hypothetical protein
VQVLQLLSQGEHLVTMLNDGAHVALHLLYVRGLCLTQFSMASDNEQFAIDIMRNLPQSSVQVRRLFHSVRVLTLLKAGVNSHSERKKRFL